MKKECILITGGCGFIGSHFVEHYLKKNSDAFVINLDDITYAGSQSNTDRFRDNKMYKFIKGNIENYDLLINLFQIYDIKKVINFAAESHVDNSIKNPNIFLKSNVNGTLQILNACYKHWMKGPGQYKDGYKDAILLHVSTDEVYGTLDIESGDSFNEDSNYRPNSPYAASKASSEMFVRSFYVTYGLNVVTTSCSNNYGEYQHNEKLIPHTITKILNNENILLHGNGKNIRDWLYVKDHCKALSLILDSDKIKHGSKYNIGADNEVSNIEVVRSICDIMDNMIDDRNAPNRNLITFVADRPGNDLRYSVNYGKVRRDFNWTPYDKL